MTEAATFQSELAAAQFAACYQCGKCTAGCPTAAHMDVKPHQAMRMLQMGQVDELIASSAPWACVGCQTCLARCPNQVDIPGVWTLLRAEAMRLGRLEKAGNVPVLEELMLGAIRKGGRVNDAVLAVRYKLKAGGVMSVMKDWKLGLKMFKAGKMKPFTAKVKDKAGVSRLFAAGPHGKGGQR